MNPKVNLNEIKHVSEEEVKDQGKNPSKSNPKAVNIQPPAPIQQKPAIQEKKEAPKIIPKPEIIDPKIAIRQQNAANFLKNQAPKPHPQLFIPPAKNNNNFIINKINIGNGNEAKIRPISAQASPLNKPQEKKKMPEFLPKPDPPIQLAKKPDLLIKKPETPIKKPEQPIKKPETPIKKPDNPIKKQPDIPIKKPETPNAANKKQGLKRILSNEPRAPPKKVEKKAINSPRLKKPNTPQAKNPIPVPVKKTELKPQITKEKEITKENELLKEKEIAPIAKIEQKKDFNKKEVAPPKNTNSRENPKIKSEEKKEEIDKIFPRKVSVKILFSSLL